MFKTDNGGMAFGCADLKILHGGSTWGTRLSQLAKMTGSVRIVTFSLPDIEYVVRQLGRRPVDIQIICNAKFEDKARQIKTRLPDVRVFIHDEVHAKLLLIDPHTVYVGSANFGSSGWDELTFGAHSVKAYDYCLTHYERIKENAKEVVL